MKCYLCDRSHATKIQMGRGEVRICDACARSFKLGTFSPIKPQPLPAPRRGTAWDIGSYDPNTSRYVGAP